NRPLGVMLCDLNGFKAVNDTYGHLVGNQLLKEISNGLRSICREYDFVARMGGDEFVLVLPEISRIDCDHLSYRLDRVANEAGQVVCGVKDLGMSVGTAVFGDDGTTCEQLLEVADRRMYAAKNQIKALGKARQSLLPDIGRLSETVTHGSAVPTDSQA